MRYCINCNKVLDGAELERADSRIEVSGLYCDVCHSETIGSNLKDNYMEDILNQILREMDLYLEVTNEGGTV